MLFVNFVHEFSKRASESWIHSFKGNFNGFVVKLTEEESQQIAGKLNFAVPMNLLCGRKLKRASFILLSAS